MIVESLKLNNFRNYKTCEIVLSPNINIFVGDNAQGKTNLLESLFFISTTRSHRTLDDIDMIRNNQQNASVVVKINNAGVTSELSGIITKEGKHLFVQKQPIKRSSDFVGKLNTIIFSPSDFELFEGSPRIRRRFMDMEIGKVIPGYVQILNSYQKILKERNIYLKETEIDSNYLDVLTNRLVNLSMKIVKQRRIFINIVNNYIQENYKIIADEKLPVKISYFSLINENDDEKSVKSKYLKCLERDLFTKQTNIGIHKDDFSFWVYDKQANSFVSQGQKRMIILALKTSLIGYIRRTSRKEAVLLLDDVLSELDEKRQNNLINLIPSEIQTIITTTSIDDIYSNIPAGSFLFNIKNGVVASFKEV